LKLDKERRVTRYVLVVKNTFLKHEQTMALVPCYTEKVLPKNLTI